MGYQIEVLYRSEIKMGSPYSLAILEVVGGYVPDEFSRNYGLSDVFLPDGDVAYFAEWKKDEKGGPGFCILRLSNADQKIARSPRILGCPKSITKSSDGPIVARSWTPEGEFDTKIEKFEDIPLERK